MRAWVFQDHRQKQKLGERAPWSVGWREPNGKKKSKRIGSKSLAEKYARKIEGQLASETYEPERHVRWTAFREQYETSILPRLAPRTQRVVKAGLGHFERLAKPGRVDVLSTQTIDAYIAARRVERGKKPGSIVAPATINRELRHLRAVLQVAVDWGYLKAIPKFRKVREADRIGPVMTPEHFALIFDVADWADLPQGLTCTTGDWWRALLAFAIATGWRIEEMLALRRDDLDLKTGAILTRAAENKGRRDDVDYLPEPVLDLVRLIVGFRDLVFWWPHDERTLWVEFHRLQKQAGIRLVCPQAAEHECTEACHYYGFHALRRAYATLNADRLPAPVLQKKMRHRSFTTTLRYIGLADKLRKGAEAVYLPDVVRKGHKRSGQ